MENKAAVIFYFADWKNHYFDMDGKELHDGDTIVHEDWHEEKLYELVSGELAVDATNPLWIEEGKARPCEYGFYILQEEVLQDARLKEE